MSDKELEAKVVITGHDGFFQKDLSPQLMQRLYYEVTRKTERLERTYRDHFIFRSKDISNLFSKLSQYAASHGAEAESQEVSVTHVGGNTLTFSSRDRFLAYDSTITEPVGSITLNMSFLTDLSGGKPINNKVSVTIKQAIHQEEKDFDYHRFDEDFTTSFTAPIRLNIEFVDYLVATALQSIVGDWVKSLEKHDYPLPRYRYRIPLDKFKNHLYYYLPEFIGVFVGIIIFITNSDISDVFRVFFAWSAYVLTTIVVGVFSSSAKSIFLTNFFPSILLNSGDERNCESISKSTRNVIAVKKYLTLGLWVTLGVSVVAGLITASLWDLFNPE